MAQLTAQTEKPKPSVDGLSAFTNSWFYKFVLYPIGQMLVFILGAAVILTLLSYLVAYVFPAPNPRIILPDLITRNLPDIAIKGIMLGFVYSMIALGYTLVYGVLKFINFAHSEVFMVGGVVAFEVTQQLASANLIDTSIVVELPIFGTIDLGHIFVLVVTLFFSMLVSGTLAVLIERFAYRPLRGAPRLVPLITAIGVSFMLQDIVRAIMSITRNDFNLTFATEKLAWIKTPIVLQLGILDGVRTTFDIPFPESIRIRPPFVFIIVSAIIMLVVLNYFVNGTKWGRGIRAVSQDQVMAGLMGINVNFMISLTFFIGGAFGGAAGALFGINAGTITPYVGFLPGLIAFIAAVLGGIGNLTGALLGGLTLGMVKSYLDFVLAFYPAIGARYTDIFAFIILIIILVFRPSGILGERVDEKV
jgi:branched-chain amino acid transport system permease protein